MELVVFGCTEKMDNPCLNGIVMEDRPIYGAKVADLTLNSFLSNPQIKALVEESSLKINKPIKSMFCQHQGPGKHSVSKTAFLDEQKNYLLHGSDKPYKVRFLRMAGRQFPMPSSASDLAQFHQAEEKRKQACKPLFP